MKRLRIIGPSRLNGTIDVSGAKNAALPVLFGTLLTSKPSIIKRVPALADIQTTFKLLENFGLNHHYTKSSEVVITPNHSISSSLAPYDLVRTMRASVLCLGPLLARTGQAQVSLPGGCAIGTRPIDFHLLGFEKLGAVFKIENGYIDAKVPRGRLLGAKVVFPFPSVGATENLMLGAALAEGQTVLENAAREPEIVDLAKALRSMGAIIQGEGTSIITIEGVAELQGMSHEILPDRVEAYTYLCAGVATRGKVRVNGIQRELFDQPLSVLEKMGVKINCDSLGIEAEASGSLEPCQVVTEPFPGFPTDMQAQLMAVALTCTGESTFEETIFENRMMHVPELMRLGARIRIEGNQAFVQGGQPLSGATVMATDLRASASLIIAGLIAKGETRLRRLYHLDRGYEKLEEKLQALGANVIREDES